MSPRSWGALSVVLLIAGSALCMVAGAMLINIWFVLIGIAFGLGALVVAYLFDGKPR